MKERVLPGVGCFLACVLFSFPLLGQVPSEKPLDPVPPFGPDATVQALERFVDAFNAVDSSRLAASFTPNAKAYEINFRGEYALIEWLDHPWQFHQIQARQLDYGTKGWEVIPEYHAALIVLERTVSGSIAFQKERLVWRGPGSEQGTVELLVLYEIRNGRIYRLRIGLQGEVYIPDVRKPRFPEGDGPVVWVDTWHGNLDAPDGSYYPFTVLLHRDGYRVRAWEQEFSEEDLEEVEILVIANAMPHEPDDPMLTIPFDSRDVARVLPSAFTPEEERAVRDWVAGGGSLLLIADHAPMASASMSLASQFGVEFRNGNVRDTTWSGGGDQFRRSDGTLRAHAITDGWSQEHRVDSVVTYLGQAFQGGAEIEPLLVLRESMVMTEASADGELQRIPVGGWMQAGVLEFEQGRVALFGEAWMFSFFKDRRGDNARFILNLMAWLSSTGS